MTKLAALDLGSNSFHLLDAIYLDKTLHFGCRLKEKVQLGAGLDVDHNLSQVAINRGLKCIHSFHSYIQEQNIEHLTALATNALRIANNRNDFIHAAEDILNIPIGVISGKDEARLIFSAVVKEVAASESGLVIDIGGGSTEFAIGSVTNLLLTESLEMGCVSYYQRFFADGKIYSENVRAAEKAAMLEIEPFIEAIQSNPTKWIAGTSGTLQSIAILSHRLFAEPINRLSLENINQLESVLIKSAHVKALKFDYLDPNRRAILPAGLAIVRAIFNSLNIESIDIAQTALCEGMLLELQETL